MPFKSKAQMKAAFAGGLGPKMKAKAKQYAKETPNIKALPARKKSRKIKAKPMQHAAERQMQKVKLK